jgi:hypothetical protein
MHRTRLLGSAVQRWWTLLSAGFETGLRAGPSFLEKPQQLADNSSTNDPNRIQNETGAREGRP